LRARWSCVWGGGFGVQRRRRSDAQDDEAQRL